MLDDIDRAAIREGRAISRLPRNPRRSSCNYRQFPLRKLPKEQDADILRILNILHETDHKSLGLATSTNIGSS